MKGGSMWHSRNSNIVSAMPTSCLLYFQWTKISILFAGQTVVILLSTSRNIFISSSSARWGVVFAFVQCHRTKLFVHSSVFLQPVSIHNLLNMDKWIWPCLLQYFLQVFSAFASFSNLAIPFVSFAFLLLHIHIQLLFWYSYSPACNDEDWDGILSYFLKCVI